MSNVATREREAGREKEVGRWMKRQIPCRMRVQGWRRQADEADDEGYIDNARAGSKR